MFNRLNLDSQFLRPTAVHRTFVLAWLLSVGIAGQLFAQPQVDYATQIKPLLRGSCFACHGALKQEAGLRLDTAAAMLSGGDSGAAVIAGDPAASLLVERVSSKDIDQRMPPEFEGEPLSQKQLTLIRDWIAQGATAPRNEAAEKDPEDHWAFQPIHRPRVPGEGKLDDGQPRESWGRNPIDAFIAERHRQEGLTAQEPASRLIMLRRLYIDLIGVPPSREEIAAAISADAEDWYPATVERLLNDPRHGERWARHWMDIWRYSDWWGLGAQLRNSQQHIWHWRDWIVESLNDDVAYDQMLRLMLAADELYPEDLDKLRATGYLARNFFLFNRPQWMEETVEHVGKGMLGLTLNCAKCHDHKYDPLEHADFYRMRAFFEPYYVRMDMLPGESDLSRDGLPRVFDSNLDTPTYRYIRGQETNPDKSKEIQPGIPEFLAFDELMIQPVALPATAWQPERQPWVIENHLASAAAKLETTLDALEVARTELRSAEDLAEQTMELSAKEPASDATADESNSNSIHETFEDQDLQRWKQFGGRWLHQPGQLEQQDSSETRAALRWLQAPPGDFEATVRFSITGGSRWRSVGLTFDSTLDDPTAAATATDSEQMVYVSAFAGGPKVQGAYQQAGAWQYPAEARQSQPIVVDREYELCVQVRGQLINASLDGQLAFAWQTPLARREGAIQLTTYDACAVFHEVTIRPLAANTQLTSATNAGMPTSPESALALAKARVSLAEAAAQVAQAEQRRVTAVAAAMRASWQAIDNTDSERTQNLKEAEQAARVEAVIAERELAAANAAHKVAVAEEAVLTAAADKQAEATQALANARTVLDEARQALEAEVSADDRFTKLVGAEWTPTRFLNSGKDDPRVEFSAESTGRRSALAVWITDRRNPLTARVAANHIWTRHMGQPLVATVFDFGRNGTPPTHPELLDWLASELIEHDWSMKHLHRLIVSSSTYQLSSAQMPGHANQDLDPDNRYWWRRVPIRLEAEVIRDSVLQLAGTLDSSMGGPPVPPAEQAASTRRSVYFFHSNNERNLFLTTFDEALVKDCYRREQSIVPQQALALTNSLLVLDSSGKIAEQLTAEHVEEQDFLEAAFRRLLGFSPQSTEVDAAKRALDGWRKLPDGSDATARANFIWALLNHNDFVTLR